MKQSEAKRHLQNLMFFAQKFRSNSREGLTAQGFRIEIVESALADIQPWLDGDRSILPGLERILDQDEIAPMDFYNMMFIVDKFLPQLNVAATFWELDDFPRPDVTWLREWEPE